MTSKTTNQRLRVAGLTGVAIALGLTMAGCSPAYGYGYTASYTPGMVAVDDGVWAVTGYDDPIFYGGDYYWRYNQGYWYRSPYLGGWNRVGLSVVPPRIRYIDRPYRYRRYVAPRGGYVRGVPRAHRSRAHPRWGGRTYRSGRGAYERPYRQGRGAYGRGAYGRGAYGRGAYGRGSYGRGDTQVRRPPAARYGRGPVGRGRTHVRPR